ncbi:MAG: serine/threonine-protein kinase [Myxococcota bacterium]
MSDACPDDNVLTQMVEGQLATEALQKLHEHMDGCRRCSELVVELGYLAPATAEPPIAEPPADGLQRPRLGRYEVLDILGQGGMGIVYVAFDRELDRRVALKVLHVGSDRGQERLRREARAMARVSHPNVVQVHEVGTFDGGHFVAMELVDGGTLWTWTQGRPWKQILATCLQAGRGLKAAHDAGLVHRDFKPTNVLCESSGRAKVSDFGLVLAVAETVEHAPTGAWFVHGAESSNTQTGAVLGTRGYMSPEQSRGEPADARSDQFSFCVTVWQVISGEHPFPGGAPDDTTPRWPRGGPKVRRGLVDALCRGLQPRPEDRWPSMTPLLAALEASIRPRRWPWLLVPLTALAVWGASEGYGRHELRQSRERCEAFGSEIDTLWNEDRRAELVRSFTDSGASFAESLTQEVPKWLDARAARWRDQATEACTRAEIDRAWDDPTIAKAAWCLEDQRIEFEVLLDEFFTSEPGTALGALEAAAAPPRMGSCVDEGLLAALPEAPDDGSQRVGAAHRQLVRARVYSAEGRFTDGLVAARKARHDAETSSVPRLALLARAAEGDLLYRADEHAAAEALTKAAYFEAMGRQDWDIASSTAHTMLALTGRLSRRAEAELWADLAAVALTLAGDPLGLRDARRLRSLASARRNAGTYSAAEAAARASVSAIESALGPKHLWVAQSVNELGAVLSERGDLAGAIVLLERALAIQEEVLGPQHDAVGSTLVGLGIALTQQGKYEQATERLQRARTVLEAPDRGRAAIPDAAVLSTLGAIAEYSGDWEKAKRLHEQALEIDAQLYGPGHPAVAFRVMNLGNWYLATGKNLVARDHFERALAILDRDPETSPDAAARARSNLAETYLWNGELTAALPRFRDALEACERALGPEHPDVGFVLTGLGTVLDGLGQHSEAIEHLDRALRLRSDNEVPATLRSITEFALAKALWSAKPGEGRDRDRALRLAHHAADAFADDAAMGSWLAEVQAWLRDKPS